MSDSNVCLFIPRREKSDTLHIINFVLETKPSVKGPLSVKPYFRLHYVTEGKGVLHMPGTKENLSTGDLFFTVPSVPYSVESEENFKYMYISFMGSRANRMIDEFKIGAKFCVFRGLSGLDKIWRSALNINPEMAELRGESVLLYSFSELEGKNADHSDQRGAESTAMRVRRYIDDHFSDTEFSLEKLSSELSYNPKYLSSVFKKNYDLGISEYLNTVRIRHSCVLIEQGMTGVKDIASLCGFRDPMYFSRIFKEQIGVSPRGYIERYRENKYGVK